MSASQFPISIAMTILMTDGDRFASLSGVEFHGQIPTRAEVIAAVADAVLVMEAQGHAGFRLPTPAEFLSELARSRFGLSVAVAAEHDAWQGFTQAELDAAIVTQRAAQASAEADRIDDQDADDLAQAAAEIAPS
jgi:hypothetical protein